MAKRKTPKPPKNADDKEQSERFIETARKHETDETGKAFEQLFKTTVPSRKATTQSPQRQPGRGSARKSGRNDDPA